VGVPVVELEQLVGRGRVSSVRVVVAQQLEQLGVVVLSGGGVGEELEQVLVTGDAAAVLRWAGAGTAQAARPVRTGRRPMRRVAEGYVPGRVTGPGTGGGRGSPVQPPRV
jgi:hypothetical protein